MPRKSVEGATYPPDWKAIATAVKAAAGWRGVRCGAAHEERNGYRLTVHHLDLNPGNCAWWNLPALCCVCHLQIQHKVEMDRPWVMAGHSDWFKPYVAGFYAWKYLRLELSRDEVMAGLDELLAIERRVVLGAAA
jgi:hypothetical protein